MSEPLSPVEQLLVDSLARMGSRRCMVCGAELQARLGEMEIGVGRFTPAAVWLCDDETFHQKRVEPLTRF